MTLTIPALVSRVRALRERYPVGDSRRRAEAFDLALSRMSDLGSDAQAEDFQAADPALDGLTSARVLRLGGSEDEAREVDAMRETWRALWAKATPRNGRTAKAVRAAVTAEDEA